MSNLEAAYAAYLRAGAGRSAAGELARILGSHLPSEAEALDRFATDGVGWFKASASDLPVRDVFVGPVPPNASPGSLWFDTCDVTVMLLLPGYVHPDERDQLTAEARARLENQFVWCALRPVLRFQVGAFLSAAPIDQANFDREVLLRGDECEPVTRIRCGQAGAYLFWMGKYFASTTPHQAAREQGMHLWSATAREWIGESYFDDAYCVAISQDTLDLDPQETEGTSDPATRMLYDHNEAPPDVTFRSAVPLAYGLRTDNTPSRKGPYAVGGRVARDAR